jgi:hypothetical protein
MFIPRSRPRHQGLSYLEGERQVEIGAVEMGRTQSRKWRSGKQGGKRGRVGGNGEGARWEGCSHKRDLPHPRHPSRLPAHGRFELFGPITALVNKVDHARAEVVKVNARVKVEEQS